jgi:hypothetical protein
VQDPEAIGLRRISISDLDWRPSPSPAGPVVVAGQRLWIGRHPPVHVDIQDAVPPAFATSRTGRAGSRTNGYSSTSLVVTPATMNRGPRGMNSIRSTA